jgi:hypothetical protein
VQQQLVHLLYGLDAEFSGLLARSCGVQRLLDVTQIAYCRVASDCHPNVQSHPEEAAEVAVHAVKLALRMFHVETEASLEAEAARAMFKDMRGDDDDSSDDPEDDMSVSSHRRDAGKAKKAGREQTFLSELNAVLCFVRCCSGSAPGKAAAYAALNMLNDLLDDPHSCGPTYRGLQQLGGAAEILPLVSRPGAKARIAAIGLLGRCLAESRRIWRLFKAQQDERKRRNTNHSHVGGSGVSGGGAARHGGGAGGRGLGGSGNLNVFESSSTSSLKYANGSPASSPAAAATDTAAAGASGLNEDGKNSVAAMTAAAAAALYGTSAAAISEARADLIDASQLPSEAKRALMSRLMSATLIELTSKDTLAMVNCADGAWDDWQSEDGKKGRVEAGTAGGQTPQHRRLGSVAEETLPGSDGANGVEVVSSGEPAGVGDDGDGEGAAVAAAVVWPAPAQSRFVSEDTVDAVMRLITGDWGNSYGGGAGELSIVIPEGLILLFGLLSTASVRPSVRCRCLTQVGMWVKGSHENARAVLNCPNWQRWFVGMQSASMRLFNRGHTSLVRSFQDRRSREDSQDLGSAEGRRKRSPASSMDIQLNDEADDAGADTAATSSVSSLRPAITSLIVDCLSSLYGYLLTDVKRGYAHWGVFLTHALKIPGGIYFTRAVVIATLQRVMRQIKSESVASSARESEADNDRPARRNSKVGLVSMPKHIADNLGATFQLVDEMLVTSVPPMNKDAHLDGEKVRPPELGKQAPKYVFASSPLHPSQQLDDFDDTRTATALLSVPELSGLDCSGSDLLDVILTVSTHMHRCSVMSLRAESKYPGAKSSSDALALSAGRDGDDAGRSLCLSWRILPVLRLVLRTVESPGTSRDAVRERCLNFLQALVSNELRLDNLDYMQGALLVSTEDNGRKKSKPTAVQTLRRREHTRLALLRILSALGVVACNQNNESRRGERMKRLPSSSSSNNNESEVASDASSTDSEPYSLRMRELHAAMLIAVANNHNLSPADQSGYFDPDMMRPQPNERPIATARRIMAVMEDLLRPMRVASHLLNSSSRSAPLPSYLSSPAPPLFAQATDKALSKKVRKSMIRALSHSDADVAELSNRQSARSALDRQRLAGSVSQYQDRRRRIRSWYEQHTWPQLLSAVHGMWDYSQLHAKPRYVRRYWSHVGVSTEIERKRRSSSPQLLFATGPNANTKATQASARTSRLLLSSRLRRESFGSRAIVDIAGAKDLPTPIFDARRFTRRRNFTLQGREEHLFSRRRRIFDTVPRTQEIKYKKLSYSSFAHHRSEDERAATRRMQARLAERSDLHQLASGIAEAIDVSRVNGNDDTVPATPTEPRNINDSSNTPTSSTDGWEAEDDAWDQAAKASEAMAAATSSTVSSSSASDIRRSSSLGSNNASQTGMSAARRSQVVQMATVAPPEDRDVVLMRDSESAVVRCDAAGPVPGTLVITRSEMSFEPDLQEGDANSRELYAQRHRRWPLSQFRRVYLRSYCLVDNSFEILLTGGRSAFFHMRVSDTADTSTSSAGTSSSKKSGSKQRRDTFVSALFKALPRKIRSWSQPVGMSSRAYFEASAITKAWQDRALSNFDYLMALNTMSGRTYNDLSQYPIFPWILSDYTSEHLDLSDPAVYRDLRKPVGALNASRLAEFRERYETFDDPIIPKFLYGSHYSTAAGVVLYFLLRSEPFTSLHVDTQDGHFDVPDRLFSSVAQAWKMCYSSLSEVKELTPEFYYLPDFLRNRNQLPLGKTQEGMPVGDVELPPWAMNSATRFVDIMRTALESEHVSQSLHRWVDLIFGYKQRGAEAVKAHNVFYYLTYEGAVHLEQIKDPALRKATELQIAHFGQCPRRLLRTPHPPRGSRVKLPRSLVLSLSANFIEQVRPRHRRGESMTLIASLSEEDEDSECESPDSNRNSDHAPALTGAGALLIPPHSGATVMTLRGGKRVGLGMAHHEIASKAPGLNSLVQMGFPSHRGLDALDASARVVEVDDEPVHPEDQHGHGDNASAGDSLGAVAGSSGGGSTLQRESSTSSSGSRRSSTSSSSPTMLRRGSSKGGNLKKLWRTQSDPRSKEAVMALAMRGDAMRVPRFSKANAIVHTATMTASSSLTGENLSSAPLISVRALHDRIHAVSSKGVVCSFLVQRNTVPSFMSMQRSGDAGIRADGGGSAGNSSPSSSSSSSSSKEGLPSEREVRAAARASAAFVPLSVRSVSPSTAHPAAEKLRVPVCWRKQQDSLNEKLPLYRPAVYWSSAGLVLACANGTTGTLSLWGISKSSKGAPGSVAVSGEAAVAGGHWSTVTSCCISADSLLTCDAEGLCLLWFLCRIPRSRRPAVSARPYFVLRGHSSPVILSAMSHSMGIAVTASEKRPTEVLLHCLPRPPPNGPDYEPGQDAPLRSIDVARYAPFVVDNQGGDSDKMAGGGGEAVGSDAFEHAGIVLSPKDAKKYVVTLVAICMSGDIVVHAHHVNFEEYEDSAMAAEAGVGEVSNDLLGLSLGSSATAGAEAGTNAADGNMPAFVMWSFDVNGTLHSWTCSDPMGSSGIGASKGPVGSGSGDPGSTSNLSISMGVRSPLQALESSRRSPIVVGGSRNGKVLFWHSLDLDLLAVYDIGASFAVHSLSLSPSDEWVAVGAAAGILVTIAMPNCRDGADPSLDTGDSLAEGVRKRVAGTVGKAATAVTSLGKTVGKRLFGWMKSK